MDEPKLMPETLPPATADMRIAGVILAGGQSSRMGGGDKCLLPLHGRPMLAHVIERLTPQVGAVFLSANGDPSRFAKFGLPVLADNISGFAGPLAGALAGMDRAAKQGFSHIVTVAADSPFFPSRLVLGLQFACEASSTRLAIAHNPRPGGGFFRQPTFALYDVTLRDDLRATLRMGVRKIIQWTEPLGCAGAVFEGFGADPFFNINTPQDLAEAEARE